MAVVEAIALNQRRVLILDTANRSSLPFLDAKAVVEVPCVVGSAGVVPVAVGEVPAHARALIESIKAVERMTIDAAVTRLARARRQGARPAPARPVRERRAAHLRRVRRPSARARGALLVTSSTSSAPGRSSSTSPSRGSKSCRAPGRERFARELHESAGRRRDHGGRPRPARSPRCGARAARPRRGRGRRSAACSSARASSAPGPSRSARPSPSCCRSRASGR